LAQARALRSVNAPRKLASLARAPIPEDAGESMTARHWSSNLLFLIIAIGTEAGIANVWKFSYLAGANGGGLFVALYFIALFLIAIPALMAEMLIGRHGGRSVVGTMQVLVDRDGISPFWKSFGAIATASVVLILSYYFVVCGWMLDYFVFGLRGGFAGLDAAGAKDAYDTMLASPARMLTYSGVIIAVTAIVIANGINKGIERVSGVLTPLRFVILFMLLIYSAIFADFGAAARFLFSIDWSKLTPAVIVTAFGQAFFSVGVGVGVLMMMGAYMKREYSITRGVLTVAIAQGLVALIAGMSIFPLVFSYHLEPTQGPGLIFVTLPVAFAQMPHGQVFGTLLFLLLSFAALTATIVIQEPIVAALEEYTSWSRPALAYGTGLAIWLMGFATVLSFNLWSDLHPLQWLGIDSARTPFELLDHLTSNIMMPLGGLMVALIAGWSLTREAVREELGLGDGPAFRLWYAATRYLVPLAILVIFYSVI
jgi:NSS family neurotransmitter:Na+ symporter